MKDKRRALVTARFELAAVAAPGLEVALREVPSAVSCTLLEVTTDVEPSVQLANAAEDPVEPAGAGAGSAGDTTQALGIEDRPEPIGRGSDDGETGTVLREEIGPLSPTADSGLREETSGDSVIVATKE